MVCSRRRRGDGGCRPVKPSAHPCAYPPIRLIDATHCYIDEVRTPLVRGLRRADRFWRPPAALFLNSRGHAVICAWCTAAMQAAFAAAGVVGTGHWLRYTFAMMMLVRLQAQARTTPEINPLKVVKVLLGHIWITSTAIFCAVSKCSGPSWRRASPIFTAR